MSFAMPGDFEGIRWQDAYGILVCTLLAVDLDDGRECNTSVQRTGDAERTLQSRCCSRRTT